MQDQITEQTDHTRRAASYWGVDGLPDILRGLVLIALGAAAWSWRIYVPLQPGHGDRCLIVFIGLVIYAFVVERPVLEILKARITYPRTGYVQPPEPKWAVVDPPTLTTLRYEEPYSPSFFWPSSNQNVSTFWARVGSPLLGIFVVGLFGWSLLGRWRVPVMIPALALALYLANRHFERPYSLRAVVALALTGAPFVWVTVPTALQGPLPFLLLGPWLCGLGIHTLVVYLRTNPRQSAQEGLGA